MQSSETIYYKIASTYNISIITIQQLQYNKTKKFSFITNKTYPLAVKLAIKELIRNVEVMCDGGRVLTLRKPLVENFNHKYLSVVKGFEVYVYRQTFKR